MLSVVNFGGILQAKVMIVLLAVYLLIKINGKYPIWNEKQLRFEPQFVFFLKEYNRSWIVFLVEWVSGLELVKNVTRYNFVLCCCSVPQWCAALCDPMNCRTPGFSVLHHLPELAQTHVHRVSDTIQPSHPLSFPSPSAFSLSQHQGLFRWVSSSHQVAKVLELQFSINTSNEHSGLISFRTDWFELLAVQGIFESLFSNTTMWRHQFFSPQPSLWYNCHIHTWPPEKP